ncbi:MAG: AAA family ATPase [Patescibacteria group bacterium]
MKPLLLLIYGPNGAGKTTVARALATKYRGFHIQIDIFSSMFRGRCWHSRQSNKDKIILIIGVLDAALKNTSCKKFFLDGVLIYRFMFKELEKWCKSNSVEFVPIYLTGNLSDLNYRIGQRKKLKKDRNKFLPKLYKNFRHGKAVMINSSGKTSESVINEVQSIFKKGDKT